MAINVNKYQALGFSEDNPCACGGAYCQPWQQDDVFHLQGTVTEATGRNILFNGDFSASDGWTLDTGFSISGGKLVATNIGNTAFATQSTKLGLVAGSIYRIEAVVTVTNAAGVAPGTGWFIKINGDKLPPENGTGTNKSQTVVWYYQTNSPSNDTISIGSSDNTIDFEISDITVTEMSMPAFAFINSAGTAVETFENPDFLTYYSADDYTGVSNSVLWNAIFDFSTLGIDSGCYQLKIYDYTLVLNRIRNGAFATDLNWWTAGIHWEWASNHAYYNETDASKGELSQCVQLVGGLSYTVQFSYGAMSPSEYGYCKYTINGGADVTGTTFNFAGTKSFTVDLNGYSGNVTVCIKFGTIGAGYDMFIDSVNITANKDDNRLISNCIDLRSEHACTLLLKAYNNDNAFNFNYTDTGYILFARLKAKMVVSGYPEEREEYRFSNNTRKVLYASVEKEYQVNMTDHPEHIHDAVSIMRNHDVFQIDGIDYVASGEYEYKGRKTSTLAQASFSVKEKTGLSNNYNCS